MHVAIAEIGAIQMPCRDVLLLIATWRMVLAAVIGVSRALAVREYDQHRGAFHAGHDHRGLRRV